jgi:hypothetical protein
MHLRRWSNRLVFAVLIAGAMASTSQAALATHVSASPSLLIRHFKLKDLGGKTHILPRGGTYTQCLGSRRLDQATAEYFASGMSSSMMVTVTWLHSQKSIYRKTKKWGAPANGYGGYYVGQLAVAPSGTYVVSFVYRGKLLAKASFSVHCGGVP